MNRTKLAWISLLPLGLLAACSTARSVDVTGQVSATAAITDPISLEFFEQQKDVTDAERVSIKKVELSALGAFTEKLDVTEDVLIAHALVDSDGDGKCTAGELWGESTQTAKDDGTFDAFAITLKADPCPAE
jgi:hypothetical protein